MKWQQRSSSFYEIIIAIHSLKATVIFNQEEKSYGSYHDQ